MSSLSEKSPLTISRREVGKLGYFPADEASNTFAGLRDSVFELAIGRARPGSTCARRDFDSLWRLAVAAQLCLNCVLVLRSEQRGAVELLVGKHFSKYLTAQGNYFWNGNDLRLTSATFSNGTKNGYVERRDSSQQSVIGDVLVYFRTRDSWLRPYLSVGTGFVHFCQFPGAA